MKTSSKEIELTGTLNDEYQLILDFMHLQGMRNLLKPFLGKQLVVKIKERVKKRSEAQNRFYWGCAIPTIKAFLKNTEGKTYTSDQLHIYNLTSVLGEKPVITDIMGVQVVAFEVKRSSEMTTTEFKEFVEELQAHWAVRGCIIPDPNQDNFISDYLKADDRTSNTRG